MAERGALSGLDLESCFQHMREVAHRRQQLEVEHEQARLSLREKQEEVRRLQQVGAGVKKAVGAQLCHPLIQQAHTEHPLCTRHCARHWGDNSKQRPGWSLTNQQISRPTNEMISDTNMHNGDVTRGWEGMRSHFRQVIREGLPEEVTIELRTQR